MSTVAEGRAKRAIAPNAKQNALARLADLKKNGGRRTDQYQVCLRSGRFHTRRHRIPAGQRARPLAVDPLTCSYIMPDVYAAAHHL